MESYKNNDSYADGRAASATRTRDPELKQSYRHALPLTTRFDITRPTPVSVCLPLARRAAVQSHDGGAPTHQYSISHTHEQSQMTGATTNISRKTQLCSKARVGHALGMRRNKGLFAGRAEGPREGPRVAFRTSNDLPNN